MAGLWLFFMALAVVYLLPGPDMILLLQTGARQGKGAALATALGLGIARGCHVALAALGLAALFKTAPWTFDVVRLVGAAYLLWIGIQCLRTTMLPSLNSAGSTTEKSHWREAIRRGLLTNLLNPKVILFNVAFLPQFVAPEMGHVWGQFLVLGLTITVMGVVVDGLTGLLSGKLSALLRRSRRVARGLNIFSGSVFTGLAVRLVVSSPK